MGFSQVTVRLEPDPPTLGESEVTIEPQTGIGRDRASAGEDGRDAGLWHPNVLRQLIWSDRHGLEKLLAEHLAGCGKW